MTVAARDPAAAFEEDGSLDFSPMVGGPLHGFYLRTRLCRRPLELAPRRAAILALVSWLPLLVLTVGAGTAIGESVTPTFLLDIGVQVRLLLVLPLQVLSEVFAHETLRMALQQFRSRGLIEAAEVPRFDAAVRSAQRLARSVLAEAILLVFAILVGGLAWRQGLTSDRATWYLAVEADARRLTAAGSWYAWVTLPLFQFLLLRWGYRLAIWVRLLWQTSRLRLELSAGHPDRAAGLGFLSETVIAFAPLLTAVSLLVTGVLSNRIKHQGAQLAEYKLEVGAIVLVGLLLVLAPPVVFTPSLWRLKRKALLEYGRFGSLRAAAFERHWLSALATTAPATGHRKIEAPGTEMTGEFPSDVEAMANFAAGYEVVRTMRSLPYGLHCVITLALATLLPLLPLLLTTVPLAEIVKRVTKIIL
jgi:hypothetical protein